jgi:hypothetical protein
MTIDLRRTVIKKKLRSFYTAIIMILLIVVLLFTNIYKEEIFKLDKYILLILIVAAYILIIIFNVIRDFNYIYYSDEGDKIVLRFFSLSIFAQKKSSIEIPKATFKGYKLEKSLLGLKEKITLLQQLKNNIAKYPAVSITSLTSKQKNNLIGSLNRYSGK